MSGENPTPTDPNVAQRVREGRQKALQEELNELADVVGPGPLVDLLLERSFQLGATDVHFDPTPEGARVRLRVDGMLHDVCKLPSELAQHVISRIKLMANMDITERRFVQDGHISNAVLKQQRDVRVASGPTIHGERIVLRLMPDTTQYRHLEELGLLDEQIEELKRHLRLPYGMILSAGPVGSGKSTTMYSCLELLNEPTQSLVTIEDPVERKIDGVNQIQVDPRIKFGFVEALRGVLRQDPDVIMIGEIRDPETAHIGVRAGLTGVTVLSTIHANDAVATIDVFREFKIPPVFIADSVQCIIAQRLVRRVCAECRDEYVPEPSQLAGIGLKPEEAQGIKFVRGKGCDACFHTGYHGRTGVFELLPITGPVRDAVLAERSPHEIRQIALQQGMVTMEAVARKKVIEGITTTEEMHRVLTLFPTI